jgi:hypothetical protein
MRVFVSWSGDASRNAAELMKSWLPNVIQQLEVWVSSQDIGKGEKWSSGLWETLSELEFGILMVTKENHNAPWILFEAGALSKTVKSRVIPILCGIDRIEIANSPLAQFQNALVMKEEIWQVVAAINTRCDSKIDEIRLKLNFEKWWPDFEKEYKNIKFTDEAHGKAAGGKGDASRFERIESSLESIMSDLQRIRTVQMNQISNNNYRLAVDRERHILDLISGLGKSTDQNVLGALTRSELKGTLTRSELKAFNEKIKAEEENKNDGNA